MKVLCIDVGGTRIKASILKPNMKLNDLKEVKVLATRTIGWLKLIQTIGLVLHVKKIRKHSAILKPLL